MLDGWRLDNGWWVSDDGLRLRAISGGGSGGGKTTVVSQTVIPPKPEEELALIRKQNEFLDLSLQETRRQNDALAAAFPTQVELFKAQTAAATAFAKAQQVQLDATIPLLGEQAEFQKETLALAREQLPFLREQTNLAREQLGLQRRTGELQEKLISRAMAEIEGTPEEQEIRKLSNARALAILKGEAPPLLPGQQERLNEVFGRAKEEAEAGLRTFGEDIAASRGMRVTDTPIGGEVLRQGRELARDLSSAKARAELDVGFAQQQFGESVRQFQEGLRQRAIENRLALTGRQTGTPMVSPPFSQLPFPSAGPVFSSGLPLAGFQAITPMAGQLAQERIAGAPTSSTTRMSTWPGTLDYVKLGTSLVGAVAGGLALSSEKLKKNIRPLDVDEYERARRTVRDLPIARYRYKWEDDARTPHIGVIAELSPDEIRDGPAAVNLMDVAGLTLAAVKGLDRRLDRLEARLPVASTRGARLPIPARAA